jgi:hypothetical protein
VLANTSEPTGIVPGYTITDEVYRGRRRIVYRGTRDRDGTRVIIKTMLDRSGGSESLRREYELIRTLDLDGVPRAVELIQAGDRVALVLEDEGRPRLKALIPAGGMDLGTFLGLADQLAGVLHQLHDRRSSTRTSIPTTSWSIPGPGGSP